MAAAIIMWAITKSPFALIFAALGPITAVASVLDSQIGSRRTQRKELLRFEADAHEATAQIASAHEFERESRAALAPSAPALISRRGADPYRWTYSNRMPIIVSLGMGEASSALEFDAHTSQEVESALIAERMSELKARASILESAPVTVDARLGIGICGPYVLAVALARSLAVQVAWRLSPAEYWCTAAGLVDEREWLDALPHRSGASSRAGSLIEFGIVGEQAPLVRFAFAPEASQLLGGCQIVLEVGGGAHGRLIAHPDRLRPRGIRVEPISRIEAIEWARTATQDAVIEGLVASGAGLPSALDLAEMLRPISAGSGLACEFAVDGAAPITIDLVEHGPHAVIGGTTGSGKSELLISWVLAMAAAYSPDQVTFLLVDFKGGSAFAPLAPLPHTVGIVTDLDAAQAERALASLRAELRFRERSLAEVGAKSIAETDVPRLVIVVDEFAAMLTEHPELHTLFSDIAARGRSLGVHLVLCTQRPAGAVRDSVLANADLRISLRVNNRADSAAVVDSDLAAEIPANARGRAVLNVSGGGPRLVQFAMANAADVRTVVDRWAQAEPPRRPWCDPLPELIALESVRDSSPGIPFGHIDLPHEQRQDPARYLPEVDGHLLVLGAPGSGKSTVLRAIAANAPGSETVPSSVDVAWDLFGDLIAEIEHGAGADSVGPGRIILLDDLDSLLARFPDDHRMTFVDRLGRCLRDGPSAGIQFVLCAQRLVGEAQSLASLMPARLMLRHASRHEYVLAGGDASQYLEKLPPGGGVWQGHRVQVALAPLAPLAAQTARVVELMPGRTFAIVSARADSLGRRLRTLPDSVVVDLASTTGDVRDVTADGRRLIILGDVDEWQSRWGALTALRPVADLLFDGCSVADYRALTRSRDLPPPLTGDRTLLWKLNEDGTASRARLPA
jgi:S-DNA-T family DNA segregation ATPase FtsK/SpoIIIE